MPPVGLCHTMTTASILCAHWVDAVLCRTLPLCESSREDVLDSIATFVNPRRGQVPYHCLIISYETFRLHAARLAVPGACDLLICDEVGRGGHFHNRWGW